MTPLILIVEDDEVVNQLLRRMLHELGFASESALDAHAAIERLKTRNFHAVITDKNMPGIRHPGEGGMDVLEYLHQHKPETPALMITAYATVETAVEAMKLGAFDYITKPFAKNDLETKLHRIVGYQQSIDPASTFSIYMGFQAALLDIIKKVYSASFDEKHFEEIFSSFRQKLDLLFQKNRSREKVLLDQRDAMANMTAWAMQLKEALAAGEIPTAAELADRIITEGNKRL